MGHLHLCLELRKMEFKENQIRVCHQTVPLLTQLRTKSKTFAKQWLLSLKKRPL